MKRTFKISAGLLAAFCFCLLSGAGWALASGSENALKDQRFLKKFMADEAALKENPKSPDLNYEMGMDYFLMEEYGKARRYFDRALKLSPRDGLMPYRIGLRFARAGRESDAVSYLKHALQRDPENSLAHIELGQLYFYAKQYDPALRHYREAARIDPLYEEDYRLMRKRAASARQIDGLHARLRKNPRDAMTHGKLGDLYLELGKEKTAKKHYRKAVELDPNYLYLMPSHIDLKP